MTTKTNARANRDNARTAGALDWNEQAQAIAQAAKDKPGSRGDQLQKVGAYIAGDHSGARIMREACGDEGAARIIALPRNVLAKLNKLAGCIASGESWCTLEGMTKAGSRKEDASIVVALAGLGAGTERQKAVVAAAGERYPGGANAQMPAALDALCFFRIVERPTTGSTRNAEYVVRDAARAQALMPRVPEAPQA